MKKILLITLLQTLSFVAEAYNISFAADDIFFKGTYQVRGSVQFITDGSVGTIFNGDIEGGLRHDMNFRISAGLGTHHHISGFIKWVPFEDLETQPAIGLLAGLQFGRLKQKLDNETTLQDKHISIVLHPFVSKNFRTEIGRFTPFISLPVSTGRFGSQSFNTTALATGFSVTPRDQKEFNFIIEAGFNLSNSFSYFAIGIGHFL